MIFAVAGSGKTTYIVNSLSANKRSLILTYTNTNYENLSKKISEKFNGAWPENIVLMTYFQFLFRFCYKPFLSDRIGAKGICYDKNPNMYISKEKPSYYMSADRYLYSNRLSFLLERANIIDEIKYRVEKYFDEFIIDEVQDIAGRDFNFLELLMDANVRMLFVGDFFQHTFDTSRDGNVNKTLFDNFDKYKKRFANKGFVVDETTLIKSRRCGKKICDFISKNLGIKISSGVKGSDSSNVYFLSDPRKIGRIISNQKIVKLHYEKSYKFGYGHKNWGASKGEDNYDDVCVELNITTARSYKTGALSNLSPATRNKLYVAITRAHGNVYLIEEQKL